MTDTSPKRALAPNCMRCKHTSPAKSPDGRLDFSKRLCVYSPPQVLLVQTPQGVLVNNAYPAVDRQTIPCSQYSPPPDTPPDTDSALQEEADAK